MARTFNIARLGATGGPTEGDDVIANRPGDDNHQLLGGNDRFGSPLGTGGGNDRVWGGAGNDSLYGGEGDDSLWGGVGDDSLAGGSGNNRLNGGGWGRDIISAEGGADAILGGAGDDIITSGGGRDTVDGGAGADDILAGDGNDILRGGGGNDAISGDGGADRILGEAGNDYLLGGGGADRIWGGEGNDSLLAGMSDDDDRLTGGAGADLFDFRSIVPIVDLASGDDVIDDFLRGTDRLAVGDAAETDAALASARDTADGLLLELHQGGTVLLEGYHGALTRDDFLIAG